MSNNCMHSKVWEDICIKAQKELDAFNKLSDDKKLSYFIDKFNVWDNYNFHSDAINIPPHSFDIKSTKTIGSNHSEICPVCKGKGHIEDYDNNRLTDTTVPITKINYTCNGCSGKGWVVVPDNVLISLN